MEIGDRFGKLTIVKETQKRSKSRGKFYLCKCDCNGIIETQGQSLKNGNTRSCGCLHIKNAYKVGKKNTKHGKYKTKEYTIWLSMKSRCYYMKNNSYSNYGGRGIKICDRWLESFENFYNDMGKCPKGLSIERINNNGDYEPNNCKWATRAEQAKNKRMEKIRKLSKLQVIRIRILYSMKKYSQQKLAERFNVKRGCVKDIVEYKTWKWL